MQDANNTRIVEVWIEGLQTTKATRLLLFTILITLYIIILIGNILVIYLVLFRSSLQSPMYYFLCGLSLSEIMFTTNLIPMLLHVLLEDGAAVHFMNCLIQFYLCASLGATECFLLAMMSFDRYIAICKPLHYNWVMNLNLCVQLIFCSWIGGFLSMSVTLFLICKLDFCGPKKIHHFFCDFDPLLELSCSDTYIVKAATIASTFSVTIFPLIFVIGTYVCIILDILKIPSSSRRLKTFSTCSSHLSVVCTYYGTLIVLYVIPPKNLSSGNHSILSLMYTVVTPLFNPIIYSLRNHEIKSGIKQLFIKL